VLRFFKKLRMPAARFSPAGGRGYQAVSGFSQFSILLRLLSQVIRGEYGTRQRRRVVSVCHANATPNALSLDPADVGTRADPQPLALRLARYFRSIVRWSQPDAASMNWLVPMTWGNDYQTPGRPSARQIEVPDTRGSRVPVDSRQIGFLYD
jgi:hypothetical protein